VLSGYFVIPLSHPSRKEGRPCQEEQKCNAELGSGSPDTQIVQFHIFFIIRCRLNFVICATYRTMEGENSWPPDDKYKRQSEIQIAWDGAGGRVARTFRASPNNLGGYKRRKNPWKFVLHALRRKDSRSATDLYDTRDRVIDRSQSARDMVPIGGREGRGWIACVNLWKAPGRGRGRAESSRCSWACEYCERT